jgi:hypothetical protein
MSNQTFPILRFKNGSQTCWLYYYSGNFFYPLEIASRDLKLRIRRLIQIFMKANKALIRADRAHPDYLTKLQLAEAQGL